MEFRRIFDTIPEQFDQHRPRYCAELFADLIVEAQVSPGKAVLTADEYVALSGTHCDHMVIPEPYRASFFEGLRQAALEHGNRIEFFDTHVLYLARKPL